jgi:hypothetical protein
MPRPSDSPEAQLAAEAHRIGVLAFFSPTLKAEGRPHVRLFSRGSNLAELHTIDEAREWLRLHEQ